MQLRVIVVICVGALLAFLALIGASSTSSKEVASIECDRTEGEKASVLELPADGGAKMQIVSIHMFDLLPNPRVNAETKKVTYSDWVDQNLLMPIDDHKYEELGGLVSCRGGILKVQVKAQGVWQVWSICYPTACSSRKPVHG
jgi:hypothetical protein